MSMEAFIIILLMVFFIILFFKGRKGNKISKAKRRKQFIETYRFPESIFKKLQEKYPHITDKQLKKVRHGLRQYFIICGHAKQQMVSMPSQVVDLAWHEFILFTKQYQEFCKEAFGHFLHHTPAEAMKSRRFAQEGIRFTWHLTCQLEKINPKYPSRLPLLFSLDDTLAIPDGFIYKLDCSSSKNRHEYCATHIAPPISCASGCASGCFSSDNIYGGTDAGSGGDGGPGAGGCGGDSHSGSSCSSGGCGGGGCGGS